jgi:tRNA(Arg) A34 adenosine deaminase TadA
MHTVDKYLSFAIQIAQDDSEKPHVRGKMHMCSVGVSRRTLVAFTNVQDQGKRHYEGHAERRVLRHFGDNERLDLYVARVNNNGHVALAKPCDRCMEAIKRKNVSRVYFTTDDGYQCIKV